MSDRRLARDDALYVFRRHWAEVAEAELDFHLNATFAAFARPETTITVARDEHGRPLAIAAAVIDDMVCLLNLAWATSHAARWALHDHLVRILIERRVKYLLVDGGGPFGALGFTTNLQHYQHLLGYELRHVIPATSHRATHKRRLIASLVVLASSAALILPPSVY